MLLIHFLQTPALVILLLAGAYPTRIVSTLLLCGEGVSRVEFDEVGLDWRGGIGT